MAAPSLDFITDEGFRGSLESDFRELMACLDASAWKAAHVLAGSIVEAVIVDTLIAEAHVTREEGLRLDSAAAISMAKTKGLISARATDLSTVVRDYRNLVHPGRAIRLSETIDSSTAAVAKALVNIVVTEIAQRRRTNLGYTAEQIASKIERDTDAETVLPHLLKRMKPLEIERLLLRVLPKRYQEIEDHNADDQLSRCIQECYRIALATAEPSLKKKVASEFVRVLQDEGSHTIRVHEKAFFRADQLAHLSADEQVLVKHHLLEKLKSTPVELLDCLDGIGKYLSKDEVQRFADPLIRLAARGTGSAVAKAAALLESQWSVMPREVDAVLLARFETWINFYREKGLEEPAERIVRVQAACEDVPF